MFTVDKRRIIGNIRTLIDRSNIKVGEFEKALGKDVGYLARLDREDNKTTFSIDFLVNAAEYLGVTLSFLLYSNTDQVTAEVEYMIRVIDKMQDKTIEGITKWAKHTKADLIDQLSSKSEAYSAIINSYEDGWSGYEDRWDGPHVDNYHNSISSNAFGADTTISGDCYSTKIKNGWLYIINVEDIHHSSGENRTETIEIWIVKKSYYNSEYEDWFVSSREYLCGTNSVEQIANSVKTLYSTIKHVEQYPVISDDMVTILDAYMEGDIEDDPMPEKEMKNDNAQGVNDLDDLPDSFKAAEDDDIPF